jgi:Carboxypeptidase regulatory-like domain
MKKSMVFVLILLFLAGILPAQETRGTIVGRVADPSGAMIPGATVVVTNSAMGTKTTVNTNAEGLYQASFLIPGPYRIEVNSAGFKKLVRDNIEVQVADRLEINFAMQVGDAETSLTVTAETPAINTESASLGSVVDSHRVADLPLTYGNPFGLIGLAGGVAFTGDARLDRPFEPTHIVGFAMGGSRGNLSDVTLDGAPTTATANGNQVIASYVPPTDIVQEFKVHLRRAVRTDPGRRHQHQHQGGHQPVPRHRLLLLLSEGFLGQRFLQQPAGARPARLPFRPVGRLLRRTGLDSESLQRQE